MNTRESQESVHDCWHVRTRMTPTEMCFDFSLLCFAWICVNSCIYDVTAYHIYLTLFMHLCTAMWIHLWVYSFVQFGAMDVQRWGACCMWLCLCHLCFMQVPVVQNTNTQDHKCFWVITCSSTASLNEAFVLKVLSLLHLYSMCVCVYDVQFYLCVYKRLKSTNATISAFAHPGFVCLNVC